MSPRRTLTAALVVALCGARLASAGEVPALAWTVNRDLRDVQDVFCHLTDSRRAWVATSDGLLATADDGKTFQPVPEASAEKVGLVTAIASCPADENRLLMGTAGKGVYLSTDGGKTFKRLGSVADKPASDCVHSVAFAGDDPSWRTIMVTHGLGAPGLSITRDLGQRWEVFAADRHLATFVRNGQTIVAAGSFAASEGRVWGIHRSGTEGWRWDHSSPGIRPTEPVATPNRWRFYFATLDGRLLHSDNDGRTWRPLVEFESSSWVSLFWTFGPTATSRLLVGYDPRNQGVVMSARHFLGSSLMQCNQGLYVGPFVKSGSTCRANANGSTFYVVMNNALWIGRRVPAKAGPAVVQAWTAPSAVWVGRGRMAHAEYDLHDRVGAVASGDLGSGNIRAIAAAARKIQAHTDSMGFTVFARVRHGGGAKAIKSVTVDAFGLGGAPATPLHDDGKHDDGAAGDGLFAAAVRFELGVFAGGKDTRRYGLPGRGALTVAATDTAGKTDSVAAVVSVLRQPEGVGIYPGGGAAYALGPAGVSHARSQGLQHGANALCIAGTGPGPWRGAWLSHDGSANVTGLRTLQFYLKGNVNQELLVQILDRHRVGTDVFDEPHYSHPVPLIAGGYLKAVTPTYQLVRVPVPELLTKGTYFLRHHGIGIALSVPEGGKPGQYLLDQVSLQP